MKTYCFKLYKSERNRKLHRQINAAGLVYNHCIALHKRFYSIERAYILFFRNVARNFRCSPPTFKKVRRYKSFTLKQAGWKLDEDSHTLTINGQRYRYFQSRRVSGKIKTVTLKRDSLGDMYVYIVTDAADFEVVTRTGKSVGYDFGLKVFLTASNGKDIISPLFFAQDSKRIKQACRNFSRKIKGSNNRQRACLSLARLYKKNGEQAS